MGADHPDALGDDLVKYIQMDREALEDAAHGLDPMDAPEAEGKRVGFEGCSMMTLRDGKIADYREVANVGPAFVELGFAPERTAKILAKEGAHLKKQPEWKRHLA